MLGSPSMTVWRPRWKGSPWATPRIVAAEAAGLVALLRTLLDATGEYLAERPSEVNIGDSRVLVTPAGARDPFGNAWQVAHVI